MVAAYVGAAWLLRRKVAWVDRAFLPALALGLAFYPMFRGIGAGQNTALTLLLLVGAWRASLAERDGLAGVLLGLLLFKPQFALLAVAAWAVARRWRTVAAFGATAAVTWAVTAAFAGVGWVSGWLDDLEAYRATEGVNADNHVSLSEAADAIVGVPASGGRRPWSSPTSWPGAGGTAPTSPSSHRPCSCAPPTPSSTTSASY